jgi:ferredoxin-type protein NapG
MEITRKEFLKNTAGALASVTVIGSACAIGHSLLKQPSRRYPALSQKPRPIGDERLIRPPGAIAEKQFLASCVRCYRCQDACDIGAIQFYTEADRNYYHTPYIDPIIKSCNLCMKCTKLCPTGALLPMEVSERAKVSMGSVELKKGLCLSYKAKAIRNEQALLMEIGTAPTESEAIAERRGPCGECYTFCPLRNRAIQLEPGSFLAPLIFTEHCVGCGMCEEICRVMVRGDPAIRVVPSRHRI